MKDFELNLSRPWAIAELGLPSLTGLVIAVAKSSPPATPTPQRAAPYQLHGSRALIFISGILFKSCPEWLQELADVTSCETVAANIDSALADPTVNGICFVTNSPGGQVSGTAELASYIRAAGVKKQTQAFIHGTGASGAYWLASATPRIDASPTTLTGSIGVLAIHFDESRAHAMQGLQVDVIRSGALKAGGIAGTALTDDQRASMQTNVDDSFALFRGDVLRQRPGVSPSAFSGATFLAGRAKQLGLIDGVCFTLDQALQTTAPAGAQGNQMQSNLKTQWDSDPKIRAEYLSFSSFLAYFKALNEGRVDPYKNQAGSVPVGSVPRFASGGRGVDVKVGENPGAESRDVNFGASYDSDPKIREEFLSRASYIKYMEGRASGRVR